MPPLYLDHNATTPVRPEALEGMRPYLEARFGNPSSPHWMGSEAGAALQTARVHVTALIGGGSGFVLFTSGGTESNSLAITGVLDRALIPGAAPHVVTMTTEHHCVLYTLGAAESRGVRVTYLDPDPDGLVRIDQLERAVTEETVLVSISGANNETGVLQPLAEIAAIAREVGSLLHADGVQMAGKVPVDVDALGVDLFTLASHKMYGPKGAGALFVRRGIDLEPVLRGGDQERGLRSGTENVPAIAGFGEAARLAALEVEAEGRRLAGLRDEMEARLEREIEGIRFNGRGAPRVPNTSNLSIDAIDGEAAVLSLEALGIAVSSGAACASGAPEPSHVLRAMGLSTAAAKGSIRVSLGRSTTRADIDRFVGSLVSVVRRLRSFSPRAAGGE